MMFYEPYPMGLSGNFLTQRMILERLDHEQFHPVVVSPKEGVALDRFRAMGVECVVIPPPDSLGRYGGAILREGVLGKFKSSIGLLQYNLHVARFLRIQEIDIIYANCVRAQLSVGLAAWLARVPILLYVKGELANPTLDFLSFLLADRVLFMCRNSLLKYPNLVKKWKSKISILEGGLEPSELNDALNNDKSDLIYELDIQHDNFNVCVVGQICPMKGQHVVIKALSHLVSDTTNLRVYIVGDPIISEYDHYMENLKNLVEEYNLSNYVRFTGWRNDSMKIISCMDLLINPSFSEGFGYVPLEGMALGLPVIATKVGVLPEAIVDGINGFLVEPGDDEGITRRWRELLNNLELCQRIGQEARRTVYANYLVDNKVTRLSEIWAEMSGKQF